MEFLEAIIFRAITVMDVVICAAVVVAIWLVKYNKKSNEFEALNNDDPLPVMKFLRSNFGDFLAQLVCGLVVLFFIDEIGTYAIATWIPGLPEEVSSTFDVTWAAMSGAAGQKIVEKAI